MKRAPIAAASAKTAAVRIEAALDGGEISEDRDPRKFGHSRSRQLKQRRTAIAVRHEEPDHRNALREGWGCGWR